MKIVQLTAENFKRLKAVEITPDGNAVIIGGRNAQGKTSVLDAIWAALGGRAGNSAEKPIRDGEDSAKVVVDLGDMVVTRTWTAKGSTVKVEAKDGAVYKSPQSVLDAFIGRLSFDPLAFAHQAPKDQVAELLRLVELPFDPDELDNKRRGVFDTRTAVGVEGKRLAAQVEGLPKPAHDLPPGPVSAGELIAKIQEGHALNQASRDWAARIEGLRESVAGFRAQLEEAETRLAEAQAKGIPEEVDVAPLEAQLEQVEATNQSIRDAAEWRRLSAEADAKRAEYKALTEKLDKIDAEKRDGLAKAQFPVDGLGFADGGVTFNGIPFSQASGAEKLRVSMAIAIALNPDLRVGRITDASLLDDDGMKLITDMANFHDFQLWIERVGNNDAATAIIEDGLVQQ